MKRKRLQPGYIWECKDSADQLIMLRRLELKGYDCKPELPFNIVICGYDHKKRRKK